MTVIHLRQDGAHPTGGRLVWIAQGHEGSLLVSRGETLGAGSRRHTPGRDQTARKFGHGSGAGGEVILPVLRVMERRYVPLAHEGSMPDMRRGVIQRPYVGRDETAERFDGSGMGSIPCKSQCRRDATGARSGLPCQDCGVLHRTSCGRYLWRYQGKCLPMMRRRKMQCTKPPERGRCVRQECRNVTGICTVH